MLTAQRQFRGLEQATAHETRSDSDAALDEGRYVAVVADGKVTLYGKAR